MNIMDPVHLVGISGSLRTASYNTALLRAAFDRLPEGITGEIVPLNGIPLYNQDDERERGMSEPVAALRSVVGAADGIVFATPEYNWSVTGALKNAVDWLSRGPDSPLDFKPAAIIGAGGGSGTARSQRHLRDILSHNSLCIVADPQVMVSGTGERFEGTTLVDEEVKAELRVMIERLCEVVERSRSSVRISVKGSILVVGPTADRVDDAVRSVTEMGYRTLTAHAAVDAVRIMRNRSIAGLVLDEALEEKDRRAIITGSGDVVTVIVATPAHAGAEIEEALRYANGPG